MLVKRVEIVVGSVHVAKVIQLLEKKNVSGYTLIPDALGKGSRGVQDGDGLHNAFKNAYILVACSQDELDGITEPLRVLLKKIGGLCLISDSEILTH